MSRRDRTGGRRAPLPVREGINPTRVRTTGDGAGSSDRPATVFEFLARRFPATDPAEIRRRLLAGDMVDDDGARLDPESPVAPGGSVWFHRDIPAEPRVPFEVHVLHRDEHLLVVDKPHFLASTPNGRHITESVVVRLRRELNLPELVAVHRLDRVTAGVLLLVIEPRVRGAYQRLFQDRQITKEYEAVAGFDPGLALPAERASRLAKDPGRLQVLEVPGEPNARTRIELIERREPTGRQSPDEGGNAPSVDPGPLERPGDLARYRLLPSTGRMHQLRVHLNALGIPIVGDTLYPAVREVAPDDYSSPLLLLARSLEFVDPLSGEPRRFESRRRLDWPLSRS